MMTNVAIAVRVSFGCVKIVFSFQLGEVKLII